MGFSNRVFPRKGDTAVTPDGREVTVVSTESTTVTGRAGTVPAQRVEGTDATGQKVVAVVTRGAWKTKASGDRQVSVPTEPLSPKGFQALNRLTKALKTEN